MNLFFLSIAISKTDIKQWCTENEYELLELEKTATSETDDNDDDDGDENNHRKQKKKRKKNISLKLFFVVSLSRCLWNSTFNSNTSYSSMAKYESER